MAQDDTRERYQIMHFGLSPYSKTNRGNQYWPDAKLTIDGEEVTVELKTKPEFVIREGKKKKYGYISTARGFTPKKADEWKMKTNLFVFSETQGLKFDGSSFNKHLVTTYDKLEPLIEKEVFQKFYNGRKPSKRSLGYYGYGEFEENIMPLIEGHLTKEDKDRLLHTIEVGNALNDPKFRWKDLLSISEEVSNKQDIINYWRKVNGKSIKNDN